MSLLTIYDIPYKCTTLFYNSIILSEHTCKIYLFENEMSITCNCICNNDQDIMLDYEYL